MVTEMNTSLDRSATRADDFVSDIISRDIVVGLILCLIACGLTTYGFWRIGSSSANMLVVTDYVAEVPQGARITLGYGGVRGDGNSPSGQYQNADLPFQSRAMSSFSFGVSRDKDGAYWAEGDDDRLFIGGKEVEKGKPVQLFDGSRLRSVGRYGSANFTARLDEQPSLMRLHLDAPIYFLLSNDNTRVTFGLGGEIVGASIDEVAVRTKLRENQTETFVVKKDETGGFQLKREEDLSLSAPVKSEIFEESNKPSERQKNDFLVGSGASTRAGTVLFKLTNGSGGSFLGAEPSWAFGFRFTLIVFLLAIAFGLQGLGMHDTQVRVPHGPLIFGCVAVFSAIGLTLAGRDFFLPPYDQGRFPEYLKWFMVSLVVLYLIRIPQVTFYQLRWAFSFPVFLLVYILVGRPFDNIFFIPFVEFAVAFFVGAVAVHFFMRGVREVVAYLIGSDWLRVLLFGVLLPIVGVLSVTILMGGRSALNIFGIRFSFTYGTYATYYVRDRHLNCCHWRIGRIAGESIALLLF